MPRSKPDRESTREKKQSRPRERGSDGNAEEDEIRKAIELSKVTAQREE